jgi:hypothetical protein
MDATGPNDDIDRIMGSTCCTPYTYYCVSGNRNCCCRAALKENASDAADATQRLDKLLETGAALPYFA